MNFHLGNFVLSYFGFFGIVGPIGFFGIPFRCWQLIRGDLVEKIKASPSPTFKALAYFGILLTIVNGFIMFFVCNLLFSALSNGGGSGIAIILGLRELVWVIFDHFTGPATCTSVS